MTLDQLTLLRAIVADLRKAGFTLSRGDQFTGFQLLSQCAERIDRLVLDEEQVPRATGPIWHGMKGAQGRD